VDAFVGTPARFSAVSVHGRIALRWFSPGGVAGNVTRVEGRVVFGIGSYRTFHALGSSYTLEAPHWLLALLTTCPSVLGISASAAFTWMLKVGC
jgi:hypothetical protein